MPMVFVPVGTENRRVGSRDMVMMIQGQVDQQQEGGNIICSDGPRDCFQFISSSSSLLAAVLCVLSMRLDSLLASSSSLLGAAVGWTSWSDSLCVSLSGRWNPPEHLLCTPLCSGYHHSIQMGLVICFVVNHGHVVAP